MLGSKPRTGKVTKPMFISPQKLSTIMSTDNI